MSEVMNVGVMNVGQSDLGRALPTCSRPPNRLVKKRKKNKKLCHELALTNL